MPSEHDGRGGDIASFQLDAHAAKSWERQRDEDRAENDGGEKRPEDEKRRVKNRDREEAEEDDAGKPPLTTAQRLGRRCVFAHARIVRQARALEHDDAEPRGVDDGFGS